MVIRSLNYSTRFKNENQSTLTSSNKSKPSWQKTGKNRQQTCPKPNWRSRRKLINKPGKVPTPHPSRCSLTTQSSTYKMHWSPFRMKRIMPRSTLCSSDTYIMLTSPRCSSHITIYTVNWALSTYQSQSRSDATLISLSQPQHKTNSVRRDGSILKWTIPKLHNRSCNSTKPKRQRLRLNMIPWSKTFTSICVLCHWSLVITLAVSETAPNFSKSSKEN